jgi:hypothetical protein
MNEPEDGDSSRKNVTGRRDQNARTTGFAPHPLVSGTGLCPIVVTRIKLSILDPELTFEQIQFLAACMCVRRIRYAWIETDQHADAITYRVRGQQFAGDARRRLLPLRFNPLSSR